MVTRGYARYNQNDEIAKTNTNNSLIKKTRACNILSNAMYKWIMLGLQGDMIGRKH